MVDIVRCTCRAQTHVQCTGQPITRKVRVVPRERSFVLGKTGVLAYHETRNEKVYLLLSRRLKEKHDLFGGLPATIDDDWIDDAAHLAEKVDHYIHLRVGCDRTHVTAMVEARYRPIGPACYLVSGLWACPGACATLHAQRMIPTYSEKSA